MFVVVGYLRDRTAAVVHAAQFCRAKSVGVAVDIK